MNENKKEIKFTNKLDIRNRLDNQLGIVRKTSETYNILLNVLEHLADHFYDGKIIEKRGNEAYIQGVVLIEVIKNAIENVVGKKGIDFYFGTIYELVIKRLDLYEVFQNKND